MSQLANFSALTERQIRIAQLVASGKANKQIAPLVELSVGTIKNELTDIYRTLGIDGCSKRAMLAVIYAKRKNNV